MPVSLDPDSEPSPVVAAPVVASVELDAATVVVGSLEVVPTSPLDPPTSPSDPPSDAHAIVSEMIHETLRMGGR